MDWKAASIELAKPLDPRHVKPPPKGKFGEYVDGHHIVSEANRIFGYGGWSYEVTRLQMVSEQTVTLEGKNGPYEQYRVGYLASVRVCVGDACREGVAVGSGVGSPLSIADHHESAVKEAETDALKRALRTFGNTFGLALYDKTKADVKAPEPTSEQLRDNMKKAVSKASSIHILDKIKGSTDFRADYKKLSEPHQNEIAALINERMAELAQKGGPQ